MIARSITFGIAAVVMVACTSGVQQSAAASSGPLTVVVAQDGSLSVDGRRVDATTLKRNAAGRTVYLRGSPDLEFSQFQKTMSNLQGLDIPIAILGEDSKK